MHFRLSQICMLQKAIQTVSLSHEKISYRAVYTQKVRMENHIIDGNSYNRNILIV